MVQGSAGYASFNEFGNTWRKHNYADKPNGWQGKWNKKGLNKLQQGTIGKSYGLVTVTRPGAKRSISPANLIKNIQELYASAIKNKELTFLVAQSTKKGLNGYTGQEMASFFDQAGTIPRNVLFQKEFKLLIDNQPFNR